MAGPRRDGYDVRQRRFAPSPDSPRWTVLRPARPKMQRSAPPQTISATKTKSWEEALKKNGWTPAVMAGKEFEDFVEYEFSSLRAIMYLSGMV